MTRIQQSTSSKPVRDFQDTALWKLKVRLQFTGWLQYAPPAVIASVFALLAVVAWFVGAGGTGFFWVPGIIAAALIIVVARDLITVKLGIHPPERPPRGRGELDAFELMRSRRSCRSFQSRDLTDTHREHLRESVQRHTRAGALLGTSPIRFEYIAAPLTVWPTVGGHEFLVAIAPTEYDRMAIIDVGRSLQHVVLDATRMGIATCWIGPGADHDSIRRHLGERFDPARDHIICVCAVGYKSPYLPTLIRAMQVVQHRRLPVASLFFADSRMQETLDVATPPFNTFGRTYEVCQWSPSSFNAQPTRCVGRVVDKGEATTLRFDFYSSTSSRYYAPVALGIWCANWETGCDALGISGHFVVLPHEPDPIGELAVPHHDVSWLSDVAQ